MKREGGRRKCLHKKKQERKDLIKLTIQKLVFYLYVIKHNFESSKFLNFALHYDFLKFKNNL